jgi:sodium/proline symporter
MTDQIWIAITFIGFMLLFTAVGIYSATQKQNNTTDYLLAGRSVNPWFTALSAMSTGQSGFLFIGQVGYAYKTGISSIWLSIGWAIGDYIAWWLFFRKLREISEQTQTETVSGFLGQNTNGVRIITVISALITIAFLGTYAAAQLAAGSTALSAIFNWDYRVGVIIGTVIVVIYCFSGGIRASIWTDTIQAIIMIFSLLLLLVVSIVKCGGFNGILTQLAEIDPALVNLSPADLPLGFIPFFLGWTVAGFGVVGQPHIMVRAMAIDDAQNVAKARNIKIIAGSIAAFASLGVGLTARVLLPELLNNGDRSELALPLLSLDLLPAVLVGLMLAGVFSATMSTADSQILSCSAALTQDMFPQFAHSYKIVKLGTLTVTAIVFVIALAGDQSVFFLVTFAWSALASALGPLFMVRVLQKPINRTIAIAMMLVGISTALIWTITPVSKLIYAVLPGMTAGILVYLIGQFFIGGDMKTARRK